jgi:hypothetical protein
MGVRCAVRRRLACLAVVTIVSMFPLSGLAAGQTGATGSIIGQVTDEGGGVLPGVTVSASSPALQLKQVTGVTDAGGEYRLTPLPIGTYTAEYSLTGFQTIRREGVRLTAGFTAKLDIIMKVGGVEETVTVSGAAPLVDAASTTITTHVTQEVLDVIPTGGNHYTSLLELAPGARGDIDVGGSTNNSTPEFRAFGMAEESWQAVEGVATKTPNISDSGNFPDFKTFEEAAISTMGHDASVPSRGVAINTVIKSGGNEYHGRFSYGGTNDRFETTPASGGSLKYRDDFAAQLGGPIMLNKIWFFTGVRWQRQERYVIGCLKPDGEPCVRENKSPFLTPKVTFQLNPAHRLVGMAWLNERIDTAIPDGGLTEWSARRNWGGHDGVVKGEWQGLAGDAIVMSLLGGMFYNHSGTKCVDETCTMTGRRDRGTGRIWGLVNRSGERNQEERKQLRGTVSWFRPNWAGGDHELKLGGEFFAVPANRALKDRAEHGGTNYRLNYRNGAPDRIEILNAPVDPDNSGRYLAFYLSDTWTIGRRLTLNLGVRYARDSIYENEGCREAAPPPAHVAFPAGCWEKTQMPIFNSVVPRLRASYDLTGDGRTTVKGGWGRYVRMRLFDHLQPMANNVISNAVYRWRDRDGNDEYTPGEIDLDLNGPDFLSLELSGTFESAGRGVVNPDEKQAYTDEFSAQFERELFPDFAVRVLGLQARVYNVVRLANRLRPYEAYNIPITSPDPGPDGRVGTADDTGSTITWYDYPAELSGFAFQQAMYVNDPRANQTYSSVEVAVSKRLSNNWQFQASHTATKRDIPLIANEDEFNTLDPNAEIFAAEDTWEWLTRLSGSYLFPYGILASARFEHRSGSPWARTALLTGGQQNPDIEVRVEPFGTRRLDHINLLSVRGEKQFRVANRHQLQLRASLNNILNTTVATSVVSLSGSSFGRLTGQVLPRVVVFEVEYQF